MYVSSSETFESVSESYPIPRYERHSPSKNTGPQRFEPPLCVKDTNSLHQDSTCRSWRICLMKTRRTSVRHLWLVQQRFKKSQLLYYSSLSKRKTWKKHISVLCSMTSTASFPPSLKRLIQSKKLRNDHKLIYIYIYISLQLSGSPSPNPSTQPFLQKAATVECVPTMWFLEGKTVTENTRHSNARACMCLSMVLC